ncbi:hypothetical protein PN499_03160 [Kamptonema animale CS-326]|jgi:hypothetical protein|uniref:hypothetical protein n=1 Tax=Kamptonema animale TaxID=92934 RepID=UPI00232AC434|nr:hypothetical protein [Kamptonema animale]MDB9510207.1 hypothetical protein [Kamptonema animale CS-326]
MADKANQKAQPSENDDLKDLKGIFKGIIVSAAWSYADILEKNKQAESQQETAQKSEEEKVEPDIARG